MQSYPIEAEYLDGYIHNETQLSDTSPYLPERNTLFDIVNKLPEKDHGPMIRFSLHMPDGRIDIDWRHVPDGSKPIRFKRFEQDHNIITGKTNEPRLIKIGFGLEYFDPKSGHNVQEIREIT